MESKKRVNNRLIKIILQFNDNKNGIKKKENSNNIGKSDIIKKKEEKR